MRLPALRCALVFSVLLCTPGVCRGDLALAPLSSLGIKKPEVARVRRWLRASLSTMHGVRLRSVRALSKRLRRKGAACLVDNQCIAKAARGLGLKQVVAGDVGSIGGAYMVYLRLVEPSTGRVIRAESGVIDPRSSVRRSLGALLTRLLRPERFTGSLLVTASVPDSWVYLDGRRVGRGSKLLLKRVRVGTHALRITHRAHRDFVRFVTVPFRERARLDAKLEPLDVQKHEMKLVAGEPLTGAELPWYRRWWAVAAFGAVVFATATTTAALFPRPVSRDRTEAVVRP